MKLVTVLILILSDIILNNHNSFAQPEDTIIHYKNVTLEEVSITGKNESVDDQNYAGDVITISRRDIERSPSSTLQDLLETVAGTDIRQRSGNGVQADINLRGGTFDQVVVMLNGMNVTDPQTGHFNLNLPVELIMIERIEIIHGIAAVKYGANAYKGIINIITKKDYNSVVAGLAYGQYNLWHPYMSASYKKNKLYNGLSLSGNKSEGYTENTDFKMHHAFYQGGVDLKATSVNWQAGLNSKAFGANDFYSPSFPEQYEETLTGFGSAGFTSGGKIKISASAGWRRHKDHFLLKRDEPSFYENYHLTDIFGIKAGAGFASVLGSTLLGVEDRYEIIHSTLLGNDSQNPLKIRGTADLFYTKYFSRNIPSLYFKQDYSLRNFSFSGGLVFTFKNEHIEKSELSPGLNISQRFLNRKMSIFASLNRTMRLPTFTDLFYKDPVNEGSPDLDPEKILSVESGLEYQHKKNHLSISFFKDQGDHTIDWVWLPDRNIYKAMNISEITTEGFEIICRYDNKGQGAEIPLLKNASLTYTYITSGKTAGDPESKYSLDYLKHKLGINTHVSFTRHLQADIRVCYNARNGSYIDLDEGANTSVLIPFRPYWLTDMKISYQKSHVKLYMKISNLLDTEYTDVGNLIQAGRWIVAGMEVHFPAL